MRPPRRLNLPRMLPFYAILVLAVAAVIARLAQLQVIDYQDYLDQAIENRLTRVNDPAPRGVIYDRRGVILARNVPSFIVTITPANLPDNDAQTQAIYRHLADLLAMPITIPGSTPVKECVPGRGIQDWVNEQAGIAPYSPVKIKCDVDKTTALVIRQEAASMPGVDVIVEPLRDYPTGLLTADIIGYMSPIPAPQDAPLTYAYYTERGLLPGRDRIGVAGVEASMQDTLGGQNGSRLIEEDVAGMLLQVVGVERETVAGQNVQLTIDVRLQSAVQGALTQRLNYINTYLGREVSSGGVAIVMNPTTGEILAMVSWPSYDNNRFARGIDYPYYKSLADNPRNPLLNHAVNVLYPPGSVFKVVTATAALQEQVIDPERELEDPGKITISNRWYPNDPGKARDFVCWNRQGHGLVNFTRAIAESCNVYFYKIGGGYEPDHLAGLGIDLLGKWMDLFGFGQFSGVELPAEAKGVIPTSKWKRINYGENWATGDTYNAVIGQGYVLVTPLQMLNAYNAVINGGTLYRPQIVDKILGGEGEVLQDIQPEVIRQLPVSPENILLVQTGLRRTVVSGTLSGDIGILGEADIPIVDVPDVNVAGKTGTAEYCDAIAWDKGLCIPGQWPQHAWTMMFAPYEKPEVSVIVFVYNGGEGSKTAAPIASAILRAYFMLKAADAGAPPSAAPNP